MKDVGSDADVGARFCRGKKAEKISPDSSYVRSLVTVTYHYVHIVIYDWWFAIAHVYYFRLE
jgi:hypothetical protein